MAEEKKVTKRATKKATPETEVTEETKKVTRKRTTKKAEAKETTETTEVKEVKATKKKTSKAKEEKVVEEKPAKKEAKAKKKVEVQKPLRTEAKASALNVKVTPRKARLVIDLVRNKDVDEALQILSTVHKRAATMVSKVIASAYANATNNFNMNGEKLYVASIMASDSIKMKRYLPRAKGSASGLVKRFSNIYVTLKERN